MSPTTPSTSWCWRWSPGRVGECAQEVVEEVKDRLGDRPPALFTSDEHAAYETAIVTAFSEAEPRPRARSAPAARGCRPGGGPPPGLAYATVRKERKEGRVVLGDPPDGGPGGRAGGGGGPEGVGVQPDDQHLVRRAAACDRSGSERAEVAADVPVQQGLARCTRR